MKETFKEAGYTYVKNMGNGTHAVRNADGQLEMFFVNKNHAGWGLIYKNTHLEFSSSIKDDVILSRLYQ